MGRNMLKWHNRRKYRIRDMPYAQLEESPDATNAGNMKKQKFNTKGLRNVRSCDKSKSAGCLARRAVINNTRNGQSDVIHMSETGDCEQSSFITISSEELHFEDSGTESEVCTMENKQSQHVTHNTFRRFSESSIASVAKMSAKWCKIRDSLASARKSSWTLPGVVDNLSTRPNGGVKRDAAMPTNSKNSLERIKRANSVHNGPRRWSLFSTGYVKLNDSDSSPSMTFGMEDVAHSTFIWDCNNQKSDKRNNGRELEGSVVGHQEPVREKCVSNASLGCIPKHTKNYENKQIDKKSGWSKNKRNISKVKKMAVPKSTCPVISSDKRIQNIKTKRLKRSMGTTRLPQRRRRNDFYNLKTLSVKSSEGRVEVKISLELSDGRNDYRNSDRNRSSCRKRSGIKNKFHLKSPLKTPVLPKRPLSRRSLFSDRANRRETTDGETEIASYDEPRCNDKIVWKLNASPSAKENSVHLSPCIGETEDQIITPPNSQELTFSFAQVGKWRPRRVRKQRRVTH